ncbi:substrate-binding domain-containing protein [Clostridium sp. KNHs216]|uniref:substrate-binding domain-containing protein n=1 Tax=Clostridium sp. KNHs216 TaxID=1550235 RepID=UPI001150028C|nr:substrate-binding domain-containing protein [Clostridium sp. KNHs216]TQI66998.1 L-arabinose transport system substrate-binding protein [Clostridium sp. KNHs216]
MKKPVRVLLAIAMVLCITLGGCTDAGTVSGSQAPPEISGGSVGEKKLTLEYFATSMTVEWIQQVEAALKKLGEEENFELLSADANRDINAQLSQIDTAIEQKIDGAILFVVDENSAPAAVEKLNAAKIPVIGESMKLQDGGGSNIAPYVELDSYNVGVRCADWVSQNYKSCGADFSDLSKVGLISNTNSKYRPDVLRTDGFREAFVKAFPGLPKSNIFMADCAAEATSNDNTEASYKQVSTVISSHPDIEYWVIMGAVDNYAMGACRAVEAAGVEDRTILVSAGGELAVKEWANGTGKAWRAVCYYDAMNFAKVIVDGMVGILRDGKSPEEIYPDYKQAGQKYAAVKITGNMCTSEDYKQYVH